MTEINVTSLAAFRRFLAMPGAMVQVTRHDWADAGKAGWNKPESVAATYAPRRVGKLQTNGVKWSNGGWTMFSQRTGGALAPSAWRFLGDTVEMSLSDDGSFTEKCIYRLSLATPVET